VTVVSVLIYFAILESPRWLLRKASRRRRLTSST